MNSRRAGARGSVSPLLVSIIVLFAGMLSAAEPAQAAPGDIGYEGRSHAGTSTPTGSKRAESVLWWNDGSWWANMWDGASQDFHIFRLDVATQTWTDTGVLVDSRANTQADVLWDGAHLYVASHGFVSDGSAAVAGTPAYLFRFSYDAVAKTYAPDSGFPVAINNYRTETLVIDKDSTGQLWATWQQGNKIHVNRTLTDDRTWGTPFVLPVTGSSVTVDDISSVVAFGGNKIGVMWSNASSTADGIYFAVHDDAQPDTTWQQSRTAIQGPETSDDHISLKSLQADASGRVFAAVKTSFNNSAQPLIMLLVRDPGTGDWASHTIARVSECPNRPMVVIDEENRVLHAFYTAPAPPNYGCNSSGGAIYEKTTPLDAPAFATGYGTPVMLDADSPYVHNVSSTKQNVNSTTDIALLAANTQTNRYWHHYQALTPSGPPSPPTADFTATPTSGTAPLAVQFTDRSSGTPSSWSWTFGDGTTSSAQHPTHTYAAAGSYAVSLTVTNAVGSDNETRSGYVNVTAPSPPTADFTATPTSGTAPLAVQFTDRSAGSPTSWSWTFGDGTTSSAQHPTHTYAAAGSYAVSLTVTNAAGSDTESRVDYISAAPPPPTFSLSVSPASRSIVRGDQTTYTITIAREHGFAGSVQLAVSGLPSGAVGTFSPNPVDTSTATTSVLTVTSSTAAKQGTYALTITGTSGSLTRTAAATLQLKRR